MSFFHETLETLVCYVRKPRIHVDDQLMRQRCHGGTGIAEPVLKPQVGHANVKGNGRVYKPAPPRLYLTDTHGGNALISAKAA